MKKTVSFQNNKGFTLVELMVAITLGLLISAAAIQVFTNGLISTRIHQANAELQDSGILGLEYIAKDIRLANHGNLNNPLVNDQTLWGGIVLTAKANEDDVNTNLPLKGETSFISDGLLSHSLGAGDVVSSEANEWQGLTAVESTSGTTSSDQLTIQFIAPENMVNCEGRNVKSGDFIIQRYFLRPVSDDKPAELVLACDANSPNATAVAQPSTITGFGGAGEIIIPRVDHLRFYLGTWEEVEVSGSKQKRLAYYSINQYKTKVNAARTASVPIDPPRVVSVKMAILVRSSDNTNNPHVALDLPIAMLNEQLKPIDQKTKYARMVYTTTAALRNAMGEKI